MELKAKMIEILGYPEELTSKGKNYVYRYTVYCPQEEMKLILQESADNRLDILRKIFNIEKYKKIRENIIMYLRTLRKEITVLETRVEELPQKEKEFLEIQDKIGNLQTEYLVQKQKVTTLKEEYNKQKSAVQEIKLSQEQRKKLIGEFETLQQVLSEQLKRKGDMQEKQEEITTELSLLLVDRRQSGEEVESQIRNVKEQIQTITHKKQKYEIQQKQLQDQIGEMQIQSEESKSATGQLQAINTKIQENTARVASQESISKRKESIEDELKKLIAQKSIIKVQLQELQEKQENITSLTHCPTCEQDVPEEHCKRMLTEMQEKSNALYQEKQRILQQEKGLEGERQKSIEELQIIEKLVKEQNLLFQERARLETIQTQQEDFRNNLKQKVVQNNKLMSEYQEFLRIEFPLHEDLQKRAIILQKRKEQILIALQLEKQQEQLKIEKEQIQLRLKNQEITIQKMQLDLEKMPDNTKKLQLAESSIERSQQELQEEQIILSKQEQTILHSKELLEKMSGELKNLRKTKTTLLKTSEKARWINTKFIPLTGHIEKEIMLKIYHYCNGLFSEWFDLLTEGSEISARLDSSFTPIITGQGHEINFAYLSGGERTAASLAYRLSLTKAINDTIKQINTKELLILDEPTDGFSTEQLQRLRDCLEAIGLKQIIIVSHEQMMEGFVENILHIEKKGGVSVVDQ